MKVAALSLLAVQFLTAVCAESPVKQVVKLLQDMLDKNKEEGKTERELYGKFKCYCDENSEAKSTSVKELTTQIGMLESQIQALLGSSGSLSIELAQLSSALASNVASRDSAEAIRTKAHDAFVAEEADLVAAGTALTQAVEVLGALGSDANLGLLAKNARFMNGPAAMGKLGAKVKQALLAANTFLTPAQQKKVSAFLQGAAAPYNTQSGEIVGILKNMKETFEANLESARTTEAKQAEAHEAFMANKVSEHDTMNAAYEQKQASISSNDADLAAKKTLVAQAAEQKSADEDFLARLQAQCADRSTEYEARNLLRANEEAAISQAISILNSDKAFQTFGNVEATSTGSLGFIQLRSVRRHVAARAVDRLAAQRAEASRVLREAARAKHSARLGHVAALLVAGNPFDKVLAEILNMKKVIVKEGELDQKQHDWCTKENEIMAGNLEAKTNQIDGLNSDITTLDDTIENPETGIKRTIQNQEESLKTNTNSQKEETAARRAEEKAYKSNIGNLVEAEKLLERAVTVLQQFYAEVERRASEESLLQAGRKEDPAPPSTWEGSFAGQSDSGKAVIANIEFILSETKKEEQAAHTDEQSAQAAYEDSMAALKTEEADLQKSLIEAQKLLADTEQELESKRVELDETEREKVSIERYMASIKPGCDFILTNFADRSTNRDTETQALDKVEVLLKASPAYAAAVAAVKVESFGRCKEPCVADETHAECKACLAGVSVPGYCAGHKDTPGC